MIKTNLPVILLKGIVLLPNNEIRLEFDSQTNKNIIDVAELFHENNILVVSSKDSFEEKPDINELPKIGVMSKITHKIELPNGKTRIIISGVSRVSVYEYLNFNRSSEVIEAIIATLPNDQMEEKEELALIRKIYRELESYIKNIPYMSNSLLSQINNHSLSKMTDIIAPNLPVSFERIHEYLMEVEAVNRARMILEDIYKEKELFEIESKLDLEVKKEIDNNQKDYILREKMKKIKEELGDSSLKEDEIEKLKTRIDELNPPSHIKERFDTELRRYENLSAMSPEMNIVRNYLEWILDLPWNTYTTDNNDLNDVRNKLDSSHYGIEKVKTRIIEYLAVKQMTNSLKSPIICLVGPPGVGKTSLAISIAKAIERNFVKISVGGVNDEAEIIGHRRTYLGANPGRIIQSMKKAKSNNPLFLIDEIDKMTRDYKGDPASVLLEVLDPEQNKFFSDNYLEEEYDLSQVVFVATANNIEDIPEPLKDRLEIIQLSGYTELEKLDIAKKHLIPKIIIEHGLEKNQLNFDDKAILSIIRHYTKEAGVRELERQIASVVRKAVTSFVVNDLKINKLNISSNNLDQYLGRIKYRLSKPNNQYQVGVVNGLAYTYFGGDTLPIEVNYYKGNGNLVLTGSLGEIMKESAHIALSYLKSNYKYYHIDYNKLVENDIHIHVPEGAIPKDGPSAGIALTTALVSAFSNIKIDRHVALTGEITLRGNVLPIGGLKEKSIGAHRNGIKKIIIPFDNLNDLDEVPSEIKKDITYIPVKNYKEVLKNVGVGVK
ncbi:MAG: endopeptidase La [Bacilli bacterium]|nr:endopeptidase La [Bacilli bacterium]MDD4808596.1 endopeptidase La [Bacilli bacterium]